MGVCVELELWWVDLEELELELIAGEVSGKERAEALGDGGDGFPLIAAIRRVFASVSFVFG